MNLQTGEDANAKFHQGRGRVAADLDREIPAKERTQAIEAAIDKLREAAEGDQDSLHADLFDAREEAAALEAELKSVKSYLQQIETKSARRCVL